MSGHNEHTWQKVDELGQGGFGFVCLYQNTTTKQYIAIKQLRMKDEFSDGSSRVWERWKQEVYMMHKLDHKNVIKAVPVPQELDVLPGDSPILGMEYCRGGDLRKFLLRPENCCGLRESYIRDLLSDIGSAIEYLHGVRIIHRDIKPENIVLQPTEQEHKYLYKIIDLGYAKELNSNSCCISHVGTQQYLAPELYGKQAYTRTVDYWSFGSLVYECITGRRPFLPDLTGVQWHKEIKKKSPDDITAVMDNNGDVKFSKNLPGPTFLCRPLRKYLEQWLKLMLRWDSKSRGGGVKQVAHGVERPKCFCVLEQILEMKIFHVMYAKANMLLSFPVTADHTIGTVHQAIDAQILIPVSQQLLVLKSGYAFQPDELAIQACEHSTTENPSVFLFSQVPVPEQFKKENKLPQPVESIVKDPKLVLSLSNHKDAWKKVVYWCKIEHLDCKQLIESQKTAVTTILSKAKDLTTQRTYLNDEMKKLLAFTEYFHMSLNFDLHQCDSNENWNENLNGMRSDIEARWKQSKLEVENENLEILEQQIQTLHAQFEKLIKAVQDTQRKEAIWNKDAPKLERCENNAKLLYEKLRVTRESLDHKGMVDIVGTCVLVRDRVIVALHESIDIVMEPYHEIQQTQLKIGKLVSDVLQKQQRIKMLQKQRQGDIWKLFTNLHVTSTAEASMNPSMSLYNGNTPSVLQSVSFQLESLKLVDDSKNHTQLMDDVLDTMTKDQEESMKYFTTVGSHG